MTERSARQAAGPGLRLLSLATLTAAIAAAAVLIACDPMVPGANASAASDAAAPAAQVVHVEPVDVARHQVLVGRVEAAQRVEVRPRVAGHVEAVLFKDGSIVRAGQPLFPIDARTHEVAAQQAAAALAEARADRRP